jgi:hypothetical protein
MSHWGHDQIWQTLECLPVSIFNTTPRWYPTFKRPASICFSEVNDVLVSGLIAAESPFCLFGLRVCRTEHADLGSSNGHGRSAKKAAAVVLGLFGHLSISLVWLLMVDFFER